MKKTLDKKDILDLLDNKDYQFQITRPSKDSIQVKFTPSKYNCFSCNDMYDINDLEVRLDTRVTAIATPKRFCKTCVKVLDDILKRLKTNQTKDWLK
tara:strand:+ start:161 stop:451 length:291 start_codon:yes stop_codon:yes gene_type:complete